MDYQPFEVKIGRGTIEIKKGAMRVAPFLNPKNPETGALG